MNYNWDWSVLFKEPYLEWLLSGFMWTFLVAIAAWAIALLVGSLVGICRTVPNRHVRLIATSYVELFRNVPLLVQMFLWYFVFPEVVPDDMGHWLKRDVPNPEYFTAVIALGLYTASRVAEQVRAGIESIPSGLASAAKASGLSMSQVYKYVLLPISIRIIVPPITSEFLTIFKNSSLALTIGLLELTAQSQQISEYTFQSFEAFTAATVLYMSIALVVTVLMHWLEVRTRIPGMIGQGGTKMIDFEYSVILESLPFLWEGMKVSLWLTFWALLGGIAIGTILALMRLSGIKILSLFAATYVNLIRSVPLILVIFWFYFLVPLIIGRPIGGFYSALIAFIIFEAAYYSEIIRAGIQSVKSGQVQAGKASGLNYFHIQAYIVLPQAFRNMIPILITQGIVLFQDTSLVFVVSLRDFMTTSSIIAKTEGRMVEMYIFAALVYFVICFSSSLFVRRLEKRMSV